MGFGIAVLQYGSSFVLWLESVHSLLLPLNEVVAGVALKYGRVGVVTHALNYERVIQAEIVFEAQYVPVPLLYPCLNQQLTGMPSLKQHFVLGH